MGLDDVVSTESAFVAAATATIVSPRTRQTLRRGAVYGVAGALKAGDVVAGAARGVVRGVRGQENGASPTPGSSGTRGSSGSGSRSTASRSRSRSRSSRSSGA